MKPPVDASQELGLVNALELRLFLFSVQTGASVGPLSAELDVLRPVSLGRNLGQGKVAVHGLEAWLEDAVCEEELNVELARNGALSAEPDEAARLLQ